MTVLGEDRDHLSKPEYEQLVTHLGLEELTIEQEAVREVIDVVDDVPRIGGAVLRKFQILDPDGVFEYVRDTPNASINNMLEFSGFLHDFLQSDELNDSIDGLNTERGFSGAHWNDERGDWYESGNTDREFDWTHPLYVDSFLAWVLVRGGAYESFQGTQAEAKALGRQFEQAILEERYEEFSAWRIQDTQWSEWFRGTTYWDETLLLADEQQKQLWLFMFTSTD